MIITVVGMSNCGKTHWAKRLDEEQGFQWFCCDTLIEERLTQMIQYQLTGTAQVAQWIGFPYDLGYNERQQQYVAHEKEVMKKILHVLETQAHRLAPNVVIDTTGSVIYTGAETIQRLRQHSRIIYLETPSRVLDQMLAAFVAHPKPIIWGEIFHREESETNEQALQRCYPKLLQYRSAHYEKSAHIRLPYEFHKSNISTEEFLNQIMQEDL